MPDQSSRQRARVLDHLALVRDERGLRGFAQGHGFGRDHMHQRSALTTGEHSRVDLLDQLRVCQDHAATRPAQSLVRREGDHIRDAHWRRMHLRRDETGDVGHVNQEARAALLGNGSKGREIQRARVGRRTGNDQLGPLRKSQVAHAIHVEQLALLLDAVRHHFVVVPRKVLRVAVREVTTVIERHRQDGVARRDQGHEGRHIGLRARVRLHIDSRSAEQSFGALAAQVFDRVHMLAATVVALARVPLGVLVGQHRPHGRDDFARRVILRRDQLQLRLLTRALEIDRRPQRVIGAYTAARLLAHCFTPCL